MTSAPGAELGSDLVLYAVRLHRLLRRERPQPPGLRVLSILDEVGELGVSQLANLDQCSQPTMSGVVNGLVGRRWVAKRPDPSDARGSLVGLTAAGRAILADTRRANGMLVAERLLGADVPASDLATAVIVLRSIVERPEAQ